MATNIGYSKLKKYKQNPKMFILSCITKIFDVQGSLDKEAEKYRVVVDITDFQDPNSQKVITSLTGEAYADHAHVATNTMSPPPAPLPKKQMRQEPLAPIPFDSPSRIRELSHIPPV